MLLRNGPFFRNHIRSDVCYQGISRNVFMGHPFSEFPPSTSCWQHRFLIPFTFVRYSSCAPSSASSSLSSSSSSPSLPTPATDRTLMPALTKSSTTTGQNLRVLTTGSVNHIPLPNPATPTSTKSAPSKKRSLLLLTMETFLGIYAHTE